MKYFRRYVMTLAALCSMTLTFLTPMPMHAQAVNKSSKLGGHFYVNNYGGINGWAGMILPGSAPTAATAATIAVTPQLPVLLDGRTPNLWSINNTLTIGTGANQETVTPTAVAPGVVNGQNVELITATFANTHGSTDPVISGTGGLYEALLDASNNGGGIVEIDSTFTGTNANITAAVVYSNVTIADYRSGIPRYWNPTPTGAALAVPTTLTSQAACDGTHQFCSDATVAGSASWGSTLFGCVAYVDIMGNEGPCSLTSASMTSVASKAIDVAAPVASAGAVGYVVYLSLSGGTYAQAYQIPSTSSNCTLTTLETVTPACAVANTTYGQAASTFGAGGLFTKGGSQITTYPVNTAMHFTKLGSVAMTAASLTPITNSSVTYSYAPSNRVGAPFISSANVVNYAASGSSATTIPNAIATWTIPANAFNYIGAEFTVSGKFTFTDGGDSSTEVRVAWDAPLSNATTVPTTLCSMVDTATGTGAAYNGTYFCTVKIATVGTTGTALVNGYANLKLAAGATTLVRDTTDVAVAPSAATVNTTAPARIVVYFIGTGATNNPGAQGLAATLTIAN